jgi:general secretion pathway protein B
MSYILDALRKADSQRERDASRGIHAQPAAPGARGASTGSSPRLALGGAVAGGVALVAIAGWYFTRPAAPVTVTAPAAVNAPTTATRLPLPQAAVAVAPAPALSSPAVEPPPANVIAPPPERVVPPPEPELPQMQPMTRGSRAPILAQPLPPQVMPAPAAAPGNAVAPAAPAPAVAGLPPDAPRLAISGGVYSPSPAQRMLIVNGQVFNEGSEVAAGVTLEKIEARTATLRFRGARYTVTY